MADLKQNVMISYLASLNLEVEFDRSGAENRKASSASLTSSHTPLIREFGPKTEFFYQHLKKCKIGFIVAVEGACLSCLIIFNLSSHNTDSKFKTKPIYGDLDQHIDYSQSQFDSYLRNLTVKQARLQEGGRD